MDNPPRNPEVILDYASPRPRSKLRLAASSVIEVLCQERELVLQERLIAKKEAILSIVFAVFVLMVLTGTAIALLVVPRHANYPIGLWMAGLWLVEFGLMLGVIHQTWRRTIVQADQDQLALTFRSPFLNRRRVWLADQVSDIRVVESGTSIYGQTLGQLQIFLSTQQTLHLFTDHEARGLTDFASTLRTALKSSAIVDSNAGKLG